MSACGKTMMLVIHAITGYASVWKIVAIVNVIIVKVVRRMLHDDWYRNHYMIRSKEYKDVKVNELDGTVKFGDSDRFDTFYSDDGMEGRLNKDLINVMKIVQHIDKLIDCKGGIGDYDRGYRASLKELRAWLGAVL